MIQSEPRRRLRERLLEAAEQQIATRGLGGLRARDLARAADCALGAIYTAFADLDALILAVNARTLARLDASLRAASARLLRGVAGQQLASARLVALATAYLDFAVAEQSAWHALFAHRMSAGRPVPEVYRDEQSRLFVHIEEPLKLLRPELDAAARARLARTMFSATHGVVLLGLEEKLTVVPLDELRRQLVSLVRALALGLGQAPGIGHELSRQAVGPPSLP